MACGDESCFPEYYLKHLTNSVLICLTTEVSLNHFTNFENLIISKKSELSNLPIDCKYQIFLIDSNLVSLLSISLQGLNYFYQRIDCLLNTVLIYFRDSTHSRGPISSQLLSAAQFHQQLPLQILKRPIIARKRLLRKRFKFVKQARDTEKVVEKVKLIQFTYFIENRIHFVIVYWTRLPRFGYCA